jgi:hypothetical protein
MGKYIELNKEQFEYLKGLEEGLGGDPAGISDVVAMNQKAWESRGILSRAQKYDRFMAAYDAKKDSTDEHTQAAWQEANDVFRAKDVQPGTVHQDATLSNVSVQYANEQYIGYDLMPVVQVGKESDVYYTYPRGERMQYPEDALGSRGRANEIEETRETATYTTLPRGLSNYVAQRTLNNQDAPLDEMVDLTESLNEGLAYKEEQRIATLLCATGTFGTQTNSLAANLRWDSTGGGNPIANIQTACAGIWRGRGPSSKVAYSSLDVYNVLNRHQSILDLYKYNGSSPGLATPDMIAGFFGISRYLVGEGRSNTATEGDTDAYGRLWSDVFGIIRVARRPTRRNASFGYTFRHGQKITVVEYDKMAGHGGGYTAQVSHSVVQKIVAQATGWLIGTPIG